MKKVFVDTAYFIAVFRVGDQWKGSAVEARRLLGDVALVTTDEVLTEFLTALSRAGKPLRMEAAEAVQAMLEDPGVKVVPQSRQSFVDGIARYKQRLDKGYSVQDCISMNVMEAEGITDILTSDHHFEQARFNILMKPRR